MNPQHNAPHQFSGACPRVYVLGGGHVGLGMALALQAKQLPLVGLHNRDSVRAGQAAARLTCPVTSGSLPVDLAGAELVLLAVSDGAIATVGAQLANTRFAPGAVLAHMSGFLPAAAMPCMHVARGSLHPLLACATVDTARDDLPLANYTIEGEATAIDVLQRFVQALGGRSAVIEAAAKARYHAACVLASNCIVGLLELAMSEVREAGLAGFETSLANLALGATQKAADLGPSAALTGPALRGDVATLKGHVQALSPQARAAYLPLTEAVLGMAQQRGLEKARADAIAAMLRQA